MPKSNQGQSDEIKLSIPPTTTQSGRNFQSISGPLFFLISSLITISVEQISITVQANCYVIQWASQRKTDNVDKVCQKKSSVHNLLVNLVTLHLLFAHRDLLIWFFLFFIFEGLWAEGYKNTLWVIVTCAIRGSLWLQGEVLQPPFKIAPPIPQHLGLSIGGATVRRSELASVSDHQR